MSPHSLILQKAKLRGTAFEHRHALHPGSYGVELLAEEQRFVAVLSKADMIPGLDQIQTLLEGAFLFLVER
jgi:hypothetical protein